MTNCSYYTLHVDIMWGKDPISIACSMYNLLANFIEVEIQFHILYPVLLCPKQCPSLTVVPLFH